MEQKAAERALEQRTEALKLVFDGYKQLTTLSAGSIVLIGTFLSDIFPKTESGLLDVGVSSKLLVTLAFIGGGLCLVVSVFCMFSTSYSIYRSSHSDYIGSKIMLALYIVPYGLLFFGVCCFGVAVTTNLLGGEPWYDCFYYSNC